MHVWMWRVCFHQLSHHLLCHLTVVEKGPFNVTITATPFAVFIDWMEPSDNITFIAGYNITVESVATKTARTVYVDGNSSQANVTGLTPFTEYSFTVTTVYQYGLGPPSEAVIQRTMEHGKYQLPHCESLIG